MGKLDMPYHSWLFKKLKKGLAVCLFLIFGHLEGGNCIRPHL